MTVSLTNTGPTVVEVALGERGPVWWDDGAPDFNRRMVANSPYARWYEELERGG